MKFKYEEIAPSKHTRYLLATGISELRVLSGLLNNACRYMPNSGRSGKKTDEYMSVVRTLRNMRKEVAKALEYAELNGDE